MVVETLMRSQEYHLVLSDKRGQCALMFSSQNVSSSFKRQAEPVWYKPTADCRVVASDKREGRAVTPQFPLFIALRPVKGADRLRPSGLATCVFLSNNQPRMLSRLHQEAGVVGYLVIDKNKVFIAKTKFLLLQSHILRSHRFWTKVVWFGVIWPKLPRQNLQ